jgi:hypothetical protein
MIPSFYRSWRGFYVSSSPLVRFRLCLVIDSCGVFAAVGPFGIGYDRGF